MTRRSIQSLIALYTLAPGIKDVWVEGVTDAKLLRCYFHENGISNIVVKEIATVEVPSQQVFENSLQDNNRGRVATLAKILSDELSNASDYVRCVIDPDFEFLSTASRFEAPVLVRYDYCCLEMYSFNESTLKRFFLMFCSNTPDTGMLIDDMGKIGSELFLIRFVRSRLCPNAEAVSIDSCCTLSDAHITFELQDYLTKQLSRTEFARDKSDFGK